MEGKAEGAYLVSPLTRITERYNAKKARHYLLDMSLFVYMYVSFLAVGSNMSSIVFSVSNIFIERKQM